MTNSDCIILTTYFFNEYDPNRKISVKGNNIEYIRSWYESIHIIKRNGIVFHNGLSKEFIETYATEYVSFQYVELNDKSPNDFRFYAFHKFLKQNNFKYILISDGNDIWFNKDPFELITKNKNKLSIGRGDINRIICSDWNYNKALTYKKITGIHIPNSYFLRPVYNAGIIGGSYDQVFDLLSDMLTLFNKYDGNENLNMFVLNFSLWNRDKHIIQMVEFIPGKLLKFTVSKLMGIQKRLRMKESLIKVKTSNKADDIGNSKHVLSGFPLNSAYKSYEIREQSDAFIIHK